MTAYGDKNFLNPEGGDGRIGYIVKPYSKVELKDIIFPAAFDLVFPTVIPESTSCRIVKIRQSAAQDCHMSSGELAFVHVRLGCISQIISNLH